SNPLAWRRFYPRPAGTPASGRRRLAADPPSTKPAQGRLMAFRTKVLIVDDNSDVRRLYAIGLNQRGFEVKLAANGAEAVERVATERPDVSPLDWVMPLMDGGEVLSK